MSVPISNVVRRVVFAPSGTGPYAFTFEILAATDIQVYKGDTLLTLTTDYSVTINTNGTGSVTLVATAGTDNITIVGARTIQRTTDFVTGGDLFANSLNTELDSLTIFTQQNSEANVRSIKAPVTDPTTIDMTLPVKADRAGKYLSFNSSTGDPEVVNTVVDVTAVANNATNINLVAGQISPANNISTVAGAAANIATVAGIAANVTTVAGISGNVTTVAGISADVTTVAADGTDIGTVAGNIANVNTVAGISANVTTVAGDSADIQTVAGISSDITAVAGIAANVTTVAGISANVTTVAGISADVTTVAGDSADIQLLAANIATIASKANAGANSDITSLSGLTTPLSVGQGGTGASTLTAENVILGDGTNAVKFVAPGTSGNVLTSNGTTWTSAAPAANKIEQGNSDVTVTDSGTGKIEFNVDAVEVADFTTAAVVFNETGADQDFRVEGDGNANLIVADAGVDKVGIGTNTFNTNGGVLQVSNGISFPATQSACSDVNTLDDYEEGTWTPDYFGGTTRGTTTYNGRSGTYTKVGRLVTITGYMNIASATGTGPGQIDGVPFASTNSNLAYIGIPYVSNINWGGGTYLALYFFGTDVKIDIQYLSDDGAATNNDISNESGVIAFTMTYQAS